jgi:hypothetical protein
VIPLLLGLEFSDISGPLSQFQAKKLGKAGLEEIVHSIIQSAAPPRPRPRIAGGACLPACGHRIEKKIEATPKKVQGEKRARPQHEIPEELVTTVRGVEGRFAKLDDILADVGYRSRRRRFRPVHPMMLEDMSHIISDEGDDPIALLMSGSMVRDDLPWVYEVLMEVYRDVRSGDLKTAQRAIERLRRMSKMLGSGLFSEEFGGSKEAHMMMEPPRALDHLLHPLESRLQARTPRRNWDPTPRMRRNHRYRSFVTSALYSAQAALRPWSFFPASKAVNISFSFASMNSACARSRLSCGRIAAHNSLRSAILASYVMLLQSGYSSGALVAALPIEPAKSSSFSRKDITNPSHQGARD